MLLNISYLDGLSYILAIHVSTKGLQQPLS